ncbi:hypothetical protein Hte_006922 [Hypoxylon texense]
MSTDAIGWETGIKGDFPINQAIVKVMPSGTRVVSAESSGVSAWAKIAKVSVLLLDGSPKNYLLKCATGRGSQAVTQGEYYSALTINEALHGFVPKPVGWGEYYNGESLVFFFLGDFHKMNLSIAPEPASFMSKIAELHRNTSRNGMFGFHVPTACGKMERTVTWEESWAKSFIRQLKDVIKYDNETNGPWPEYDAACKQLIDAVIPRLLGALQSDGRKITPSLIHGDLWENNLGTDAETGETVLFDPGCIYAHNEMEFGTWRCTWARYFNKPIYMEMYQHHIKPSEPVEEWDDRNRLYSIHPYLNDSAGHAGSASRKMLVI